MANPNEFSQPASYLNGGPFETTWGPYATKEAACLALKNEVDADGKNMRMGKKVAIGTMTEYVEHAWQGGFEDFNLEPCIVSFTSVDEINPNLFNRNDTGILDKKGVDSTGTVITADGFKTSPVITLPSGKTYILSGFTPGTGYGIVFLKPDGTKFNNGAFSGGSYTFTTSTAFNAIQFTCKTPSDVSVPDISLRLSGIQNEIILSGKESVKILADNLKEGAKLGNDTITTLPVMSSFVTNKIQGSLQLQRIDPNPNLFNAEDPAIQEDKRLSAGTVIGSTGSRLSPEYELLQGASYKISGFTGGAIYGVVFKRSDGTIFNHGNISTPEYSFSPGSSFSRFQFTCKVPSDTVTPDIVFRRTDISPNITIEAKSGEKLVANMLTEDATQGGKPILTEAGVKALLDQNELLEVVDTNPNLFDSSNAYMSTSNQGKDKGINGSGDIISIAGYALSHPILVNPSVPLVISNLSNDVRGIQYQNTSGVKVGHVIASSFPFTITPPETCYRIQYTCKLPSESVVPATQSVRLSGVPIEVFVTTKPGLPLYADGVYHFPFSDKKLTIYGDSITVAYASDLYKTLLQIKTNAHSITKRGSAGQAWAGQLQTDALINSIIADNPDVVVMHCVNDHRVSSQIGDLSSAVGSATVIGGLKKIFNALIASNKNVHIVMCTPLTYAAMGGFPGSDQVNSIGKFGSDYADAIFKVCRVYGIPVVDLSSNCEFRPIIEATTERVYTSDGIHPIQLGYEKMTHEIAKVINGLTAN